MIKTGLGERLVSDDVEGKSFTELPIIDLSRLQSTDIEERRALAAEVRSLVPRRVCTDRTADPYCAIVQVQEVRGFITRDPSFPVR